MGQNSTSRESGRVGQDHSVGPLPSPQNTKTELVACLLVPGSSRQAWNVVLTALTATHQQNLEMD